MRIALLTYKNEQAISSDDKWKVVELAILKPGTFDAMTFIEADSDHEERRRSTWSLACEYELEILDASRAVADAPGLTVTIIDVEHVTTRDHEGYLDGDVEEDLVASYPLITWRAEWWRPAGESAAE